MESMRAAGVPFKQPSRATAVRNDLRVNWRVYLMALPMIAFYVVICYMPMYGSLIAFQQFSPAQGIMHSKWIGLKNFVDFFNSPYAVRVIRNTFTINIFSLVFGFPAPIILALLFNEIRSQVFKRTVQTVSYLPHFISMVVICGMIKDFTAYNGLISNILAPVGLQRNNYLLDPEWFQPIFVASGIWQDMGWSAIIYLAALTAINPEIYEAAVIDGAGRWRQTLHVTIPGILPTVVIMLILRMGEMMSVGYEKVILLYNPTTYETGDVISSFVYRKGLLDQNYGYSTAVGLFNSAVNFLMLFFANQISRRLNETSLW